MRWHEQQEQLAQERLGQKMAHDVERATFIENGGDAMGWALLLKNASSATAPANHGKTNKPRIRKVRQVHVGRVTALGRRRHARMRAMRQLIADGLYEED